MGERRQALKALEEVNSAITAEISTHHYRVVAPSFRPAAPTPAAAPAAPSKEEELERRLRDLRGWDAPSSTRLLSPLGGGGGEGEEDGQMLEDELHSPLSAGMTSSTMLDPSAPPLFLDDGPPLPPLDSVSVNSGLSPTELETAFKSLRLAEADDHASRVRRYYPSLPSPVGAKKKKEEVEEEEVVSPFAVPGQESWFNKRGMLRRMVLPSGLVGKFLEIADANSRKVGDLKREGGRGVVVGEVMSARVSPSA